MLHSYAHTRDMRTCKCIYAFARMYIESANKKAQRNHGLGLAICVQFVPESRNASADDELFV
jgi:hypothetical protein